MSQSVPCYDTTPPPDSRTLREVEAYLSWSLNGSSNLISRLQVRMAELEERLRNGNLDPQEKKRVRKARSKAIAKIGHCRIEVQTLEQSLAEVRLKIVAQDRILGLHSPFSISVSFANPFVPFDVIHSGASSELPTAELQTPRFLSSTPFTPYPYNPYVFTPAPYNSVPTFYTMSPHGIPLEYFFSSMSYGFNPMPAPVPMQAPRESGSFPSAKTTITDHDSGIEVESKGSQPSIAASTFHLTDPPAAHRRATAAAISQQSSAKPSPSTSIGSQKIVNISSQAANTIREHSRRYSAVAEDLLVHRLRSTKLLGHRRGQNSTASDPEKYGRIKPITTPQKRYSFATVS